MSRSIEETLNKIYDLAGGNADGSALESLGKGQLRKRMQQIKSCIRSYRERVVKGIAGTVSVDPETDDMIVTFDQDFIDKMGWKSGDTLIWEIDETGVFIKKKNDLDKT